jgi:hypothetical protein
LKIYPDPVKLLMAFQETVPPPVLEMILAMMGSEIEKSQASPSTGTATVQELD